MNSENRIKNRALFEYVKIAFKTLQKTYQSNLEISNNYRFAASKLENILCVDPTDIPLGFLRSMVEGKATK